MQQIYLNNTKENIKNSIIFINELPFNEACIRPHLIFSHFLSCQWGVPKLSLAQKRNLEK